ncbi:hypothetical protein CITRIK5_60286 [Citricoccus sp. K5]|nr:hypothetical protein CITRIK5_60286 [Citricoccus sp. K5]
MHERLDWSNVVAITFSHRTAGPPPRHPQNGAGPSGLGY